MDNTTKKEGYNNVESFVDLVVPVGVLEFTTVGNEFTPGTIGVCTLPDEPVCKGSLE